MFLAKLSADGPDAGKWYMMAVEGKVAVRRVGYCARNCEGHSTQAEAIEHFLQYQLDREVDLWLSRRGERVCEICGEPTTLRARLGRKTQLFVLCQQHQSTISLQKLARTSLVAQAVIEA
ncbi:MAG TPA: hypothetical protein VMU67_14280 [Steroidobacteraceae bacterium]|nr:hypothetical protein [Steroidobacteraceae bacterium]